MIEFLYLTGWRTTEVLTLEWRNVDFTAGAVRLEPGTTKNDEGREFPFSVLPPLEALPPPAARADDRDRARDGPDHPPGLPSAGRADPGLPRRVGGRVHRRGFFRRARARRAGSHGWRRRDAARGEEGDEAVHDFRRTAVRNLERAGVPRSVAMKLTGHKTESVYRRYAIVAASDLVEGVKKLATLHATEAAIARTVVPFPARSSTELAQSGGESVSGRRERVDEVRGLIGAGRGNRTPTGLRPPDFESGASA